MPTIIPIGQPEPSTVLEKEQLLIEGQFKEQVDCTSSEVQTEMGQRWDKDGT